MFLFRFIVNIVKSFLYGAQTSTAYAMSFVPTINSDETKTGNGRRRNSARRGWRQRKPHLNIRFASKRQERARVRNRIERYARRQRAAA